MRTRCLKYCSIDIGLLTATTNVRLALLLAPPPPGYAPRPSALAPLLKERFNDVNFSVSIDADQVFKENEDMLSRFLKGRERHREGMSEKYLRDIVLSFIIVGRNTIAGTISWLFYLICKYPDVQEKVVNEVREEIKIVAGVKSSINEFLVSLGEEVLSQLHYLHACLTETLWIYPAVPVVHNE